LVATIDEETSDSESFLAGIRQMTYDTSDGRLTGWVNGRRFMAKGGNWGFSELNLRYTQREYDKAVAYHAQQNFTMIRNWVGQTGDEEFYQACDKYGIMVWQDFWLANPYDGPDPFDEAMFMQNADNYVRRIRNHPSIALYCGRNEGNPPASLDGALRDLVAQLTDIQYISHSSRGLVSGEGNYWRMSDREFFEMRGNDRIHSERGMPNILNYESMVKMIPQEQAWPIGQLWAEHDWAKNSAMRSETFTNALYSMFGDEVPSAERYCSLAQWVNYNGYRAMFEGRSLNRRGLLLWMSHSCWPSLVWSTYDYWFDPTGAFYGCKKACEPFHIQYNASTHKVEVVNVSGGSRKALAKVEVMDMYGKVLSESSAEVCSEEDTTIELSAIDAPAGQEVYFLRLKLSEAEKDGAIVSENFYVLGAEEDNLKALCALPAAKVSVKESVMKAGQEWVITATLTNTSKVPAMMLHIAPYACGERVLPYDAQDNYFHLMPGESRQITVRMDAADVASCGSAHGAKPSLRLNGFNC
ncbi:MAG: beta-glycosidase, partial [Bacteroidales bacterium]|nr:beta-glycosidase [Bacteroidales bacterium]